MNAISYIFCLPNTSLLLIVVSSAFTLGFNKDSKLFNLSADEAFLKHLEDSNNILIKNNKEKFGANYKKYKLNLKVSKLANESSSQYEEIPFKLNGTMIAPDTKFPFDGEGELDKVVLDGKTLYSGNIPVHIKSNNSGAEKAVLSIRYEPEKENIDVSITVDEIGDTSFFAFGEPFLTNDDLNKIEEIIRKGQ